MIATLLLSLPLLCTEPNSFAMGNGRWTLIVDGVGYSGSVASDVLPRAALQLHTEGYWNELGLLVAP
jgi:hypothetical protein